VITDLFTVASGLDPDAIAGAVPPGCRAGSSPPPVATIAEGELLLEFPEWRPRAPARHLVPSLSVLTDAVYGARFELSAWMEGMWSRWVASAVVGGGRAPARSWRPSTADALACDIDVYTAAVPAERVRLRIRVAATDPRALAGAPWLATLSACDLAPVASEVDVSSSARLSVPPLSQLTAPPEIAPRICSPTSVAMVLGYWGVTVDILPLAAEIFHPESDRYGVWPAAIQAAGRRGVAGYLLRFPDWSSAAWCLARKLPIIASIQYAAGELTDAAIPATSGHLVVLTGSDGHTVSVNDPAAPPSEVQRRYALSELHRAWLTRTGIGYVLFRPDRREGDDVPRRAQR
jgi:hypothetical protein